MIEDIEEKNKMPEDEEKEAERRLSLAKTAEKNAREATTAISKQQYEKEAVENMEWTKTWSEGARTRRNRRIIGGVINGFTAIFGVLILGITF